MLTNRRESPTIERAVYEDIEFRVAVVVLLILMKTARWRTRRLIAWRVSWPAMKKNPLDTAMLLLVAAAYSTGIILYLFFPRQIASCGVELPAWLRWSAVASAVGAVFLLGWADYCLGHNLSVTLQIKENHTLITGGPYRWLRHPIYTAALLFAAAVFAVSANWLVGLSFFGPIALLVACRIPREEKMMIGHFGDRYREYVKHTGRLLPRLTRSATSISAADDRRPL